MTNYTIGDVISLCSGLMSIGPRFDGAVDPADMTFKYASHDGTPPDKFIQSLKKQAKRASLDHPHDEKVQQQQNHKHLLHLPKERASNLDERLIMNRKVITKDAEIYAALAKISDVTERLYRITGIFMYPYYQLSNLELLLGSICNHSISCQSWNTTH